MAVHLFVTRMSWQLKSSQKTFDLLLYYLEGSWRVYACKQIGNHVTLVAGAWTEREKMYHGGSFLKLADDNMDIQNPEAQNRAMSRF